MIVKLLRIKQKKKSIGNEFKKLETLNLSYFIGKNYFEEDGAENYLVFQPISRYFKINGKNHANLKDYLTKLLHLMLPLIIVLLDWLIIMVSK